MYLTSVNGLNKSIQNTQFYKDKRPTAKPILIDRCNFVINSIVEGNRHNWELKDFQEVPINGEILQSQLSCKYLLITKLLEKLDFIKINHSYISQKTANANNKKRINSGLLPTFKAESKKYSLTNKSKDLGIIKVGVLSERTEERLLKYKTKLLLTYLKDKQIHSKIFYNLTELHFDYNNAHASYKQHTTNNNNIDQAQHYYKTYNALKSINDYTTTGQYIESSEFYYTQSKLVNRVFHYYSNIPKDYRKCLKHSGGNMLAEIDLKNSQPLIIALNYISGVYEQHNIKLKKVKEIYKDIDKKKVRGICCSESILNSSTKQLLNNVLTGTFYKTIAEHGLKEGNTDFYNLFINDYSKFKGVVLGEGLYFNLIPLHKIKDAERYLLELYPDFMKWIRATKSKNGYKSISIQAQLTESSLFINDLFLGLEHGKHFAVPVHDSILVKSNEVDYFKSKLFAIFGNRFPMLTAEQIKKLFTITYYN